jgi:hypothetical protein
MHSRLRTKQRGIVFVATIIAMVVMFTIGTTFMAMASQQFSDARRDLSAVHAVAMADAGLHYIAWRQKYSTSVVPMDNWLPAATNMHTLAPSGAVAPTVQLTLGSSQEDKSYIWLIKYNAPGSTTGYQAVCQGWFRQYSRAARGVFLGVIATGGSTAQPPPTTQLQYATYTQADLHINSSTDVTGPVGSNSNVYINCSGGGSMNGDVYAAGSITLEKNTSVINGSVDYGTKIYNSKGKDVTASPGSLVTGDSSGGATTQPIPAINRDAYKAWADSYGTSSYLTSTNLNSASVLTTPIVYANPNNVSPFVLDINANLNNLTGPLVLFVNGSVRIEGNTTVGSEAHPVVIIATGDITLKGNCAIYGVVWSSGTFGGGTPNLTGSAISGALGGFQGNPQLNFKHYDVPVTPPAVDPSAAWSTSSWELL